MKLEGEFQVVEIRRMSSGLGDVVLSSCGPSDAVRLRIEGINLYLTSEITTRFGERVRVAIEISKVTHEAGKD